MRYRPIIFGTIRRAAEDVELAGVRIPAGTLVAANTAVRQPRPRRLRGPGTSRHHPSESGGHPHLRWRRALLPRRPPGAAGTDRSSSGHHPTHAQPAPDRTEPMEGHGRNNRTPHRAAGVRPRTLGFAGMTDWTAADLPSFAGRTVIITGANSGLGAITARELARNGAKIIMAVRNTGKGEAAARQITGDVEVRRTRPAGPVVGAPIRRRGGHGRHPDQQRRRHGRAVRARRSTVSRARSAPTISGISR